MPGFRSKAAHGRHRIIKASGAQEIQVTCRIDTLDEIEYFKNGGILPFVLRNLMKAA